MSSNAADRGDMEEARKMGRISMWVSIAGIIISVVLVIIIVILWFVYWGAVVAAVSDAASN